MAQYVRRAACEHDLAHKARMLVRKPNTGFTSPIGLHSIRWANSIAQIVSRVLRAIAAFHSWLHKKFIFSDNCAEFRS